MGVINKKLLDNIINYALKHQRNKLKQLKKMSIYDKNQNKLFFVKEMSVEYCFSKIAQVQNFTKDILDRMKKKR